MKNTAKDFRVLGPSNVGLKIANSTICTYLYSILKDEIGDVIADVNEGLRINCTIPDLISYLKAVQRTIDVIIVEKITNCELSDEALQVLNYCNIILSVLEENL